MNWGKFLFSFDGRITRKAFWLFFVVSLVIALGVQFVALGPMLAAEDPSQVSVPFWIWIVFIPLIWISLAVQSKRWHDLDKSAWWILIGLIPLVGALIVLIMCGFQAGTPGPNRFGDAPMA